MKRSDHENFNSETTGLEVPLPKGKMRLYRRDAKDGRPEFTGESAPHEKTVSDRAEWGRCPIGRGQMPHTRNTDGRRIARRGKGF